MKTCSRCKKTLPLSEFGKNRQTPTGLNYYCRQCSRRGNTAWVREKSKIKMGLVKHRVPCFNAPECAEIIVVYTQKGEKPCPRTCPKCRSLGQPSWRGF